MSLKLEPLSVTATQTPGSHEELVEQMRTCFSRSTPIYPVGGGTALDYGLVPKTPGVALHLAGMARVIDYPARDMTVTVEAGMTVGRLNQLLAQERQQLPWDVPHADRATVGGVVATNWNGCRRYGYGSVRDYVIGIHAVDGRGSPFKGGGRVVKNVAGYDFCKMLTGSLGTIGVIDQLTFRLRPLPETSAWVACPLGDLNHVESVLASLVHSAASPTAIELVAGADWGSDSRLQPWTKPGTKEPSSAWLLVGLEGTAVEVDWMVAQLRQELAALSVAELQVARDAEAARWLNDLTQYSATSSAALVLKASVRPSGVAAMMAALQAVDPRVSLQVHAGNGQILARYGEFPKGGMSRDVVGRLQSEAQRGGGSLIVVSNPAGQEMTARSVWGVGGIPWEMMHSVKRQFDPRNLLNPGRFVFP